MATRINAEIIELYDTQEQDVLVDFESFMDYSGWVSESASVGAGVFWVNTKTGYIVKHTDALFLYSLLGETPFDKPTPAIPCY